MAHDALGAHTRDELGLSETHRARPIQAAMASAASFAVGALLPVMLVAIAPIHNVIVFVTLSSLVFLATLGSVAAKAGGARVGLAAARVTIWGALAMAATAAIGHLFGTVLG